MPSQYNNIETKNETRVSPALTCGRELGYPDPEL